MGEFNDFEDLNEFIVLADAECPEVMKQYETHVHEKIKHELNEFKACNRSEYKKILRDFKHDMGACEILEKEPYPFVEEVVGTMNALIHLTTSRESAFDIALKKTNRKFRGECPSLLYGDPELLNYIKIYEDYQEQAKIKEETEKVNTDSICKKCFVYYLYVADKFNFKTAAEEAKKELKNILPDDIAILIIPVYDSSLTKVEVINL